MQHERFCFSEAEANNKQENNLFLTLIPLDEANWDAEREDLFMYKYSNARYIYLNES